MRHIAFILLVASALSASLAQLAFGADMPVKAPVGIRAAVYNWTGFYIGGYAGGAWGRTDVTRLDNFFPPLQSDPTGVTLGGLLGYNFQSGAAVLGIEGDAGWLSAKTSTNGFTTVAFTQTSKIDFEGRIRGRLGYAMDRVLPFVAGGVSFGHQKLTVEVPFFANTTALSKTHTGWNIGGGLDYACQSNWIGRIEYIYDQFPGQTYAFGVPSGGAVVDRTVKFNTSTVRAALIYQFR